MVASCIVPPAQGWFTVCKPSSFQGFVFSQACSFALHESLCSHAYIGLMSGDAEPRVGHELGMQSVWLVVFRSDVKLCKSLFPFFDPVGFAVQVFRDVYEGSALEPHCKLGCLVEFCFALHAFGHPACPMVEPQSCTLVVFERLVWLRALLVTKSVGEDERCC